MLSNTGFSMLIALLVASPPALGGYASIDSIDGSFDISAGQIDGVMGSSDHTFSMSDLDIIAATLQNDGIETQGRMTFLLASTDAGFSFVGLFDGIVGNNPNGSEVDQFIGVSATTGLNTDWFASGDTGSQVDWYDMGNNTQLVTALLGWEHGQTSAGFAWANVPTAPTGTMNLYAVDLTEYYPEPIQFLTYEEDHWSLAQQASFSVLGQYAFSHQFVPTPGAIVLFALAGISGGRRRRK